MSAAKTSRNRQRKALYTTLADKGSRNQDAIEAPIVGHFETVTHETRAKFSEDGELLREIEVPVRPYQKIVHDDAKSAPKAVAAPKTSDRGKARRRPNPENKNPVGRCEAKVQATRGVSRCDLRKGHDGEHTPRPFGAERKNGK